LAFQPPLFSSLEQTDIVAQIYRVNTKILCLAAPAMVLVANCSDHAVVGVSRSMGNDASIVDAVVQADLQMRQPGLEGHYFDNIDLSGEPKLIRIDPMLDMLWEGPGGPTPEIPNIFSARWSGWLVPTTTETYTIQVDCDDGSRIWIDDQLTIDLWLGGGNSATGDVDLTTDRPHKIVVEFFSFGGNASIELRWSSATIPLQLIPGDRFSVLP
jgi:PA14 domain